MTKSLVEPGAGQRIGLLLLSSALLVVAGCGETEAPPAEVIRGVLVARVENPGGERERVLTGVARSAQTVDLSFRVDGEIVSVGVKTGDIVDAGTLVAEVDRTDFRIELQEARASLAQAEAEVRNAEASYARARALYEREGIARTDLESARAAAESGRASVSAAQQRVRAAQRRLDFTRLTTPSDGAISAVPVELRENVAAGQVVAVLRTGGPPEIEVAFPEVLIAQVEVGDRAKAVIEAFPDTVYDATVRKVGIAPEESGATFPVTLQLDADWDRIRPGMAAEVRFGFEAAESSALVVPASAVGQDAGGHFVFAVEDAPATESGDGAEGLQVTRRIDVTVGPLGEEGFEIESGLRGGETIVLVGVPRVRDGMIVRAIESGDWP